MEPQAEPLKVFPVDPAPTLDHRVRFAGETRLVANAAAKAYRVDTKLGEVTVASRFSNTLDKLAVSPDGRRAVSTSGKRYVVWEVGTGAELATGDLVGDKDWAEGLSFSPDGKHLFYLAHFGGELCRLEVATGRREVLFRLADAKLIPTAVRRRDAAGSAMVRDGLYAIGTDTGLLVYDLDRRLEVSHLFIQDVGYPDAMAVSADSKRLAVSYLNRIHIYDTESWKPVAVGETPDPTGHPREAVFSPDGRTLVASTGGALNGPSGLTFFDAHTGARLGYVETHPHYTASVAISPDGKQLATVGTDGVKLWDREKLQAAAARAK